MPMWGVSRLDYGAPREVLRFARIQRANPHTAEFRSLFDSGQAGPMAALPEVTFVESHSGLTSILFTLRRAWGRAPLAPASGSPLPFPAPSYE